MGRPLLSALLLLLLLGGLRGDTFSVSMSSSLTLVSGVAYTLNATFTSKTISAGAYALVALSANFNLNTSALTSCMYATTLSASYAPTTFSLASNSSGNFISFASLYPASLAAESQLSLKMTMPNPWGAGSEPINLTIFDSAGNALVSRQTSTQTYTASPLNSCQWSSSSEVNGASSMRTISFVPSVPLIQTAFLQINMPVWFATTPSNLLGTLSCSKITQNVDFTPTCSNTVVGGTTEVFTMSNIFASNKTAGGAVSVSMGNLRNPWSLNTLSPISYQLYNTQNGVTRITQSCSDLTQTTTAMNTFATFSAGTFPTISAPSTKAISFTTRNPIPVSGGQIRLSWTNGVSVSYTIQSGVTVVSQNSSQITLSNFITSNLAPGSLRPLLGWSFVNPPSTRPFTLTLTSLFSSGGATYGIDSTTNTYSCNSGTISAYSFSAASYAINAFTTYTIAFTTINALTAGSFIGILFPPSITVGAGCSSTNGLLGCSVANSSYGNVSVSGAVAAGTSLSIKFTSVTNPTQAFTSDPFLISTYYDSGLDSLVDKLTTGMTFTGVANQIPPSNVYLIPSSTFTYASTNYIFSVTLLDKILAGGYISIIFPSAVALGSVSIVTASFSTSSCSLAVSGSVLNLTNCFAADYAPLGISFTLSGITNPPSFEPTSSFSISTYGPLGMINYISSGLPVTMTSASTSTAFTIAPQTFLVHASAVYTISVTFLIPHSSGDYLLLPIPASMQIAASPSCTGSSGVVTCSALNATTAKMVLTSVPSTSISFTFSTLRNYDISTNIAFQCYVYTSSGYLMETTSSYSVSFTADAITTFAVGSNNQIILNAPSNISITLSTPFAIDSSFNAALTSLLFTIPVEFSLASSSCSSTAGTACNLVNSTSFEVVAPGISLANVSIQFRNIQLPYIVGSSTSFSIEYLYNGLKIATVSSGVVVRPFCTSPCQQCTSSPVVCLSCLPAPNNLTVLYAPNSTCVSACPSGFFINSTICSGCVMPCLTCTSAAACLTCNSTTIFYAPNNSCITGCPSGYYNSSDGNCTLCVAPCSACSSATSCLACLTNFLYNNSCLNASSCPAGTYGNSSTNTCDSCSAPCSTCFSSMGNCTSCNGSYALYNNSCLSSCPATMYANSSLCVQCVAPCFNCSSSSFCLSCSSSYLYNGSCYNSTACPPGTFANLTALICDACLANCSTCSLVSSNCTSCASPYFNYNGTCVNACPSGLFQNVTVCASCLPPCATCTSETSCLSCSADFYTNHSCVNAALCPAGTFANSTALNCDPCSANCTTCWAAASNCTSCTSPLAYYNGTCIGSCPTGLFQNISVCSPCLSPCATCSTSATSCTSCSLGYLLNFTCVNASLCPPGTFPNASSSACESCSANCTTCSLTAANCSSCSSPHFYFNGTCSLSCPSGMFQNSTVCSACVPPCATCTAAPTCLSCSTNYYTNFTCVAESQCPAGTFANLTALNCDACLVNCSTCALIASNCTSCASPYFNYNGACVNSCPSGLFQNVTVCSSCVSPCATCTSQTACLSCSVNFYTNHSCVNASLCPAGTFANLTALSCDPCSSNCTTCSSASSNCTSCTTPLAFYGQQCLSLCPNSTFQNGSVCSPCSSPCSYCTGLATCTSCAPNFYFYNQSCLSSSLCPNGTYPNSSTLKCSACAPACLTCSAAEGNCTTCAAPRVYYNFECLAACPMLMYNSSNVCVDCAYPCGNCTSSTGCLSCLGGFLTSNSCVSSASCPNGTYPESSNNTCNSCQLPCTSCSTAANCTTCFNTHFYFNYSCVSTCPNVSYSNGSICSPCAPSCLTCSNAYAYCTSCQPGLNFYNNTCIAGCPPGTYNSSSACVTCSLSCFTCSNYSVCTGCSGVLYLTNNQCLSTCPSGTYENSTTNTCGSCSSGCATCSASASNCSTCSGNLLYHSFSCSLTCPTNYFNISGVCTTCPFCNSCINATSCFICASGYYLYQGGCYSSCPSVAPYADALTSTCSLCGSSCSSCSSDGSYCFTCASNYLMLSGQCYVTCPTGYTPDSSGAKCTPVKAVSAVYYPFTISLACLSLIFLFSKFKYAHSDLIGNTTAFLALGFLLSTAALTFPTYVSNASSSRLLQSSMSNSALNFLLGVGIAVVSILFLTGLGFIIFIIKKFDKDPGVQVWKKNSKVNRFMFWLISFLSCFHFAIFRFIYSKLFLRECFSCYFKAHKRLVFATNALTFVVILLTNVPSIALSIYIIMKQEGNSQIQIFAIDNLIVSTVLGILLLLDMGNRTPEDFQSMLEDFPYLKKTKKYQDLDSSSGSLMSIHYSEEDPHYKTEVDDETLGKLGRVNAKDKLGNFGVIDHLDETIDKNVITKTLPEFNKLKGDANFDPYQLKRINDDLFFQEKQYTKKFNEIKEEYTKGMLDDEVIDDDGATHHNQDLFRESVNVEQLINQRKKEIDPQEFLDRFKSEDYDNLTQQELGVLMEMAEQKGLDPAFIKETFGKNKYYNKKILEDIIGDHDQVSKESLRELLNEANSQAKLRQVLGKKSTISTDKLIDILNDPHYRAIIEAMFNKETGFLSVESIKELLADNTKYSKEFIINLLNNQNIDRQKLKQLIESNKEGELQTLKTVKSLGGDNLEREERLGNMLGKDSPLNPTLIPKIKKEMSEKSISNVFDKKSPANNAMIKRVINNKRVNLSELNPISEMPEIIQEFAELLTCGNEDMEQNLIELLQNNHVDGYMLKQLIKNSGNSQEEMAKLLQYIKQNKENNQKAREETPVEQWPQDQQQREDEDGEQSSLPSLNFSINQDLKKAQRNKMIDPKDSLSNFDEDSLFEQRRKINRTRFRKKQERPLHLPSEEIYLQRIQAPHEVLRGKKFRKTKKKTAKQPNKFMDEDNQVYDFDF